MNLVPIFITVASILVGVVIVYKLLAILYGELHSKENDELRVKFYYLSLLPAKDREFPYSIHGLWPQEGVRRTCKKFDIERLRVILPELHANWHSSRGPDEHFWKHEWEKHGSCTGLTEVEYFQKTLDCFEKVKANGKEWTQKQRSNKIPFDLNFQIVSELYFLPN